jgi:hypothetical protein
MKKIIESFSKPNVMISNLNWFLHGAVPQMLFFNEVLETLDDIRKYSLDSFCGHRKQLNSN